MKSNAFDKFLVALWGILMIGAVVASLLFASDANAMTQDEALSRIGIVSVGGEGDIACVVPATGSGIAYFYNSSFTGTLVLTGSTYTKCAAGFTNTCAIRTNGWLDCLNGVYDHDHTYRSVGRSGWVEGGAGQPITAVRTDGSNWYVTSAGICNDGLSCGASYSYPVYSSGVHHSVMGSYYGPPNYSSSIFATNIDGSVSYGDVTNIGTGIVDYGHGGNNFLSLYSDNHVTGSDSSVSAFFSGSYVAISPGTGYWYSGISNRFSASALDTSGYVQCMGSSDRAPYVCDLKPNYPLSSFSVGNFFGVGVRASDNVAVAWGSTNSVSPRVLILEETGSGINVLPSEPPVEETCFDGIQNQDETAIDVGGVCGYDYQEDVTEPVVNGICGEASRNYAYTGSSFVGDYCNAGTLSGSVSFPDPGAYSNWVCKGSGSGATNATCYAYRFNEPNYCQDQPDFDNLGNLKFEATTPNQPWIYSTGAVYSCSYSCVGGYSGTGCSVAPESTGNDWYDTVFSYSKLAKAFTDFWNWLKTLFEIVDLPGNSGIDLGNSAEKMGVDFNLSNVSVGLGSDGSAVMMTINGTTCSKYDVGPGWSSMVSDDVLKVHTKKSYLYSGNWNCYVFNVADYEYDLSKMIEDGKFTYMKDPFGNEVSIVNTFKIKTDFTQELTVNTGYDVKIFGYSVISEPLSKTLGFFLDSMVGILKYSMYIASNYLDIIAMGTINYGCDGYAVSTYGTTNLCHIAYMGDLWPYFRNPKTGDNRILDAILMALTFSYLSYKFYRKG